MTAFLINILLALAWIAMSGRFSLANLAFGLVVGYLLLWFGQSITGPSAYFRKVRLVCEFALFVLWELIKANIKVAYDVVTPRPRMRSGIVAIPLDVTSDVEITLLANLITLTPGTLTVDVSTDRRVLYMHAMYIEDVEEAKRDIKQGFERRILEMLR